MIRSAVRLVLALVCVGLGFTLGSGQRVRAQPATEAAQPITAITAGAGAPPTLYVVRGGEPFECRMSRVPGATILESTAGYVCEPLPLHFR
jgi:hypothetical protein